MSIEERLLAAQRRYADVVLHGSVVRIEYRHVSGHKGTVTPRNAVNTWCDTECTRLLTEARSQKTCKS